jgi:hypothetical protein
VDPIPDPPLLRNLVATGLEPGPLDLYPGTLTTRPQIIYTDFSYATAPRQPPNLLSCLQRGPFPVVNYSVCEADHTPPSNFLFKSIAIRSTTSSLT